MKKLTDIELEELSYFPNVIYEEVIRPERKTPISKKEKLNNTFATISSELTSYSVAKDETIREVFETAYTWKNENPELIKEVITSYCPIRMSKNDISTLVDNAIVI
jgi:hypothetical protein